MHISHLGYDIVEHILEYVEEDNVYAHTLLPVACGCPYPLFWGASATVNLNQLSNPLMRKELGHLTNQLGITYYDRGKTSFARFTTGTTNHVVDCHAMEHCMYNGGARWITEYGDSLEVEVHKSIVAEGLVRANPRPVGCKTVTETIPVDSDDEIIQGCNGERYWTCTYQEIYQDETVYDDREGGEPYSYTRWEDGRLVWNDNIPEPKCDFSNLTSNLISTTGAADGGRPGELT